MQYLVLLMRQFRNDRPRRLPCPQRLERHLHHRQLSLRLRITALGLLLRGRHATLQAVEIRKHQLRLHSLRIAHRIDRALNVRHIAIFKTSQHMRNRIHLANMRQKLVPQPLTTRSPTHQPGNIHKLKLSRNDLLRVRQLGQHLKPRIRHSHAPHIRLNRTKRVVSGLSRSGLGKRIEQRGLAHIRQTDNSAIESHSNSCLSKEMPHKAAQADSKNPPVPS